KYTAAALIFLVIFILLVHFFSGIREDNLKRIIRIGALLPLSGGLATYGEPAKNMAMIAQDEINADGGINGQSLEIAFEDHKCDPKTALSAFEKLLSQDNVRIFTSVACSGTVSSIAPTLQKKNAILLGTVTSADRLSGISPNFFRNWASDKQEAKLLADEIVRKGYKTVGVIYEETDYAKGLKLSLEGFLEGTGVAVSGESFISGSKDVRSQIAKIKSVKPEVVFVSVQTVPSGEIVLTQMEQMQFHPNLFVNDNIVKAASLVRGHSMLLEGAIGGDYVFQTSKDLSVPLSKYKERYGAECPQINICAAEYDAIKLIAEALRSAGEDSSDKVRQHLKNAAYQGLSGKISFDASNDRTDSHYSLFIIKEGKTKQLSR
ncbi:MAG: hypothetical protein JWO73_386, partial [Candidatus Taylorbacteria bacterium]|nr:hypothetical protein [Candidatus Taylorbacteria bacterium]